MWQKSNRLILQIVNDSAITSPDTERRLFNSQCSPGMHVADAQCPTNAYWELRLQCTPQVYLLLCSHYLKLHCALRSQCSLHVHWLLSSRCTPQVCWCSAYSVLHQRGQVLLMYTGCLAQLKIYSSSDQLTISVLNPQCIPLVYLCSVQCLSYICAQYTMYSLVISVLSTQCTP